MKLIKMIVLSIFCSSFLLSALDDNPTTSDISQTENPTSGDVSITTSTISDGTTRTFSDALILQARVNPDGTTDKKNDFNRYDTPFAAQLGMMSIGGGFKLSDLPNLFNNYPSSSEFFPYNATLAASFSSMTQGIQGKPIFFAYLKELYSTVLQELYFHLKKTFANINLTNIPSENFLRYEQDYGFNTKTLVTMHLLNIANSQSYKFSQSLFSKLPKSLAAFAGNTLLRNDTNINLALLTINDTDIEKLFPGNEEIKTEIHTAQQDYKQLFKTYFNFFRSYTGHLLQIPEDTAYTNENLLARELTAIRALVKTRSDSENPIIPQFFFPTKGTIRAVKLIPVLARQLAPTTLIIGWPQQIVTAAVNGTLAKNAQTNTSLNFPVAYFKDAQGNETKNQNIAQKLCVNMPSGNSLFEQEILRQPDWLNSQEGILNVTRACLGDFTAIVGMDILRPETEALINQILLV